MPRNTFASRFELARLIAQDMEFDLLHILSYASFVVMGVSLGLIGGGGSILTVPILVYLLHIDATLSTAYSLFIVGLTSAVGSVTHFKKGNVNLRVALYFGAPAILSVYAVRLWLVPALPDIILSEPLLVSKDTFILVIFAVLMVLAAYSMIKPSKPKTESAQNTAPSAKAVLVVAEGLLVGGITGLVGAGGGFLIIPALVLLAGLPMKQAVGTSLVIIAAKSLIGFTGDLGAGTAIDYTFLLVVSAFAVVGIFVGAYISRFISNEKLKPIFGWFVLLMGIYILGTEIL